MPDELKSASAVGDTFNIVRKIPAWVWVAGGVAVWWFFLKGAGPKFDRMNRASKKLVSDITRRPFAAAMIDDDYKELWDAYNEVEEYIDELLGFKPENFIIPATVAIDGKAKLECAEALASAEAAQALYVAWDAARDATNLPLLVLEQFEQYRQQMEDWLRSMVSMITGLTADAEESLLQLQTRLQNWINTTSDEVTDEILAMQTRLQNFINNLSHQITEGADNVTDAVADLANDLLDNVNDIIDPDITIPVASVRFDKYWEKQLLVQVTISHGAGKIWLKRAKRRTWRYLNGYKKPTGMRGRPLPTHYPEQSGCSQLIDNLWYASSGEISGNFETDREAGIAFNRQDLERFFDKIHYLEGNTFTAVQDGQDSHTSTHSQDS